MKRFSVYILVTVGAAVSVFIIAVYWKQRQADIYEQLDPALQSDQPGPIPADGELEWTEASSHADLVRLPLAVRRGHPIDCRTAPNSTKPLSLEPPPEVKRMPSAGTVYYGVIPLEAPSRICFAVVPPGEGEFGATLYLDRNRDGDLTNDDPPLYKGEGTSRSAAVFDLDVIRSDGSSYPYSIWLWTSINSSDSPNGAHWFNFYSKCWKEGRLKLAADGRAADVNVIAVDADNTGMFASGAVIVDWNGNGRAEQVDRMKPGEIRKFGSNILQYISSSPYSDSASFIVRRAGISDEGTEDVRDILAREPLVGNMAPKLDLVDLDGQRFTLADCKGRVVLLDFWATWCGPCMKKIPEMKGLHEKYGPRGLEMVGISLDGNAGDLRSAVASHGILWRQCCDGRKWESDAVKTYHVDGIPSVFVIGRDGRIVFANNSSVLEEAIEKALLQAE